MAVSIDSDCINCGACVAECPQGAISEGPAIHVVDPTLCCECVGFHSEIMCAAVCPVDCCAVDESGLEEISILIERAKRAHPGRSFADPIPSHR